MDADSDHQDLLQLLYSVPFGLVHTSLDGDIELINSASARWLMPLSSDGRLDNLFTLLSRAVPGLRERVKAHGHAAGPIVEDLRIESSGGRRRHAGSEFVAFTLSRLDDRRLMAVFNDVTQQVRDERALADSAAHYRAVVSVLSEGIVVHDPDGAMLTCNAAAQRLLGAPTLDGEADPSWLPQWPDGRPMTAADLPTGAVLRGAPAIDQVSLAMTTASGPARCFEVSARPVLRPETTELLAVVTSFSDVTLRQTLQAELHQHREHLLDLVAQRTGELESSNAAFAAQQKLFRVVADAVPGMISYWDTDLRCRFANKAYLEWFGIEPEVLIGRRLQDLMGATLFELNRAHVEAALCGKAQHFQNSLQKPDGSTGHTLDSFIPDVVEGRVLGFNAVASDVTELKLAEFRLERLNEQLARRALEADAATQAKSAFLANMSHEIRTPMNAIIGLAHLLQRDSLDALQRTRLGKIQDASQHLLSVINDILDLSKIESGKMNLDDAEFDVDDLLSRALAMVADMARAKSLVLVLECGMLPRRLRGDAVRLSQCLINLLGNAVKFTDAGWVRLLVEAKADQDGKMLVRFEVQDTGAGIAPERQGALFNAFEQADNSSTRRHGGTGLGLALTSSFARRMGGDAGVSSAPGEGSTFWFSAKLGAVDDAAGGVWPALQGLRALLVDDFAPSRRAVERHLMALGLEVDAPSDAVQAGARLEGDQARAGVYDFVLVGSSKVLDGLLTLESMKARRPEGLPPCLLMVTQGDDDVERLARDGGFEEVIFKPATLTVMGDALMRSVRPATAPARAMARRSGDSESCLRQEHAGQRILLVEDNAVNQEVAGELLRLAGLQVETADNGARAVELMSTSDYDLVLMDIQMPVMDGLTATRAIRALPRAHTPILAMTANAFGDDRAACLAAGMDDHVAKPVDPASLYAALLRWLPVSDRAPWASTTAPAAGPTRPLMDRLSSVAELDCDAALGHMNGETEMLERVLQCFIEMYAQGEPGLAAGERERPADHLRSVCHGLRGACATVGATALHSELAAFEQELELAPASPVHAARASAINQRLVQLVQDLRRAMED